MDKNAIDKIIDKSLVDFKNRMIRKLCSMTSEEKSKYYGKKFNESINKGCSCVNPFGIIVEDYVTDDNSKAESVVRKLKAAFDLNDFQIEINDQYDIGLPNIYVNRKYESIYILINDQKTLFNSIDAMMRDNGYNIIRQIGFKVGDKVNYSLIYTPIVRIDIRKELNCEFLYHATYSTNSPFILKSGLKATPRNNKQGIFYPPRVYMSVDRKSTDIYVKELVNVNIQNIEEVRIDIYYISTDMLKKYTEIYYDPLYGKTAVYVTCDIPRNFLKKREKLVFTEPVK